MQNIIKKNTFCTRLFFGLTGFFMAISPPCLAQQAGRADTVGAVESDAKQAPAEACTRDDQCRGDRICHEGRCVFDWQIKKEVHTPAPSGPGPVPGGVHQHPPVQHQPPPSGYQHPVQHQPPPSGYQHPVQHQPHPPGHQHPGYHVQPGKHDSVKPGVKGFSSQGTLELGVSAAIAYSYGRIKIQDRWGSQTQTVHSFSMDPGFYLGYFITNRFVMGFHLMVPVTYDKIKNGGSFYQVDAGFVASPGIALPIVGEKTFFYADALIGVLVGRIADERKSTIVTGTFGAEAGIKRSIGNHAIFRIGLRPTYRYGKIYQESLNPKVHVFQLMFSTGISMYF